MDIASKTLHYIGKNTSNAFVVQIGAMDGINFDDTRGFLDMYKWDALLVEPIPDIFNELKENFKDRKNYIFEQCAIDEQDGEITMLTVPPDVIIREGLHPGYKGMSAVYPPRNGFGSDYARDIEVREKFGIDVKVPSLTFESLLKKHNVTKFDILICDAEGYDWKIFNQVDLQKYRPSFIRLEYINLTDDEKRLTEQKLRDNGYTIEIGQDIDAVDATLWNKICGHQEANVQISEQDKNNVVHYIEKYGSDKKISGYGEVYGALFQKIKPNVNQLLEIGIGSINAKFTDSMVGIFDHYPQYKPGASLRAWRDYFEKAKIYGVDIDEDCKIEEERINTFIFDSRDKSKCDEYLKDLSFDVIIDDGNHSSDAQLQTLKNLLPYVKNNGLYIIEDCLGGTSGSNIINDHYSEVVSIMKEHEYLNFRGGLILIRKTNSKLGNLNDLDQFLNRYNKPNIPKIAVNNNDLTVVTGLWNIGRHGRDFTHYIENFKKFLDFPVKMFIYIPEEYEYLVWEKRSKENTYVKIAGLDYIKHMYEPFWDKTQAIRTDPIWINSTGEGGWLKDSPQATLEWYNPIVQSKMFLLNDATIWNPFNTEYFIWLDAGISNTVYENFFIINRALDKIIPHLSSFLFLSYPYETNDEIHGFNFKGISQYAGEPVKYVCRGGLFGGKKDVINQANATYYSTLASSLSAGYMGTEESIFAIMSYREPNIYRRYALDGNGLIVKFIQALIDDKVTLEPIKKSVTQTSITQYDLSQAKTNLYILTFNFPEQLQHTINSMEKVPEWINKPHLVLIDNSTDERAVAANKIIADKYNFEYICMATNTGICGGRQKAAEHFHGSDANYMFFFEDDMTVNPPELKGEFCRNGFRKYIPNLYQILHKIMIKENFDFLKMSFTEVYFDNDKALPWYNVPQHIRTRDWPDYDKLPITGLDPNSPPANYKHIKVCDGLAYITGEINYANWPMIVSKEGNKKMFIDTKWAHPFEQTWSSHIYQITKEGKINSGLLLASPIWHERIKHYLPEQRREN